MFRKYSHLYIFILIILAFGSNYTFSQSCDDCGKRMLGVYDPYVSVPRPTGDAATVANLLPRWWQLFRAGDAILSYLHNQDPSHGCITFIDIHIMRAEPGTWSSKDSLVFGTEYANTPPAGPIKSLDYLIESVIVGSDGNYTLSASVQAAVTREVVATGSVTFGDMWNTPDAAQQLASQFFSPIYDKIRQWEEEKREEDSEVTMGAETITIIPQKTEIETGEQVTVDFEFKDCDDKPLKNKKLQLVGGTAFGMNLEGPTGGQFTPSYINTDDEGKASATFTAGGQAGDGVLRAYFIYKYPSGHDGIASGEALINISQAPVDYYEFTVSASISVTSSRDTSSSFSVPGASFEEFYQDMLIRTGSCNARGLIKNQAYEPGQFFYDDGVEPIVAGFVSGNVSETIISQSGEYVNGQIVSGDIRMDAMSGPAIPDMMGLQFYYDENSQDNYAGFGVTCKRVGSYKGKWYDGPDWVDYDGEYDDSSAGISVGWDPVKGSGSFTKTDSGYVVNCTVSETRKTSTPNGPETVNESRSFSMHIRPYSYLTSVEGKDRLLIPDRSTLYQNYPNPFNPVTNIDYFIAKDGMVTIKIYDVLGKEISTLFNDYRRKGFYSIKFNAGNLTSGIYFYKLSTDGYSEQKKLVVLK